MGLGLRASRRLQPWSHVSLTGLVRGLRHATVQKFAGIADNQIPLKSWAGIDLVGLDVVMAKNALVALKVLILQFVCNEFAVFIAGIFAFDLRKYLAESCR